MLLQTNPVIYTANIIFSHNPIKLRDYNNL